MISRNLPVSSRILKKRLFFWQILCLPGLYTSPPKTCAPRAWFEQGRRSIQTAFATPFQRGSRLSQHAVQAEIIWPSNWADPLSADSGRMGHRPWKGRAQYYVSLSTQCRVPKFLAHHLHWRRKKKSSGCTLRRRTALFRQSSSMCTCRDPMV